MNSRLFDVYRAMHEQGFVPIFTEDGFDSKMQVEACLKAGIKCIEYTLRRRDAKEMIPWIRKNYPNLYLIVGSTIDDDKIIAKARRRHPQLMTVTELEGLGVDGFVSVVGWSSDSIKKYSSTHFIAPLAMTVTEALQQVGAGAHFVKLAGPGLDVVKMCRSAAAFDYCPIMVTGGMTPEKIHEAISAGAAMVGAGFDLTLKGRDKNIGCSEVTEVIKAYLAAVSEARKEFYPEMSQAIGGDKQLWLDSLPHYHPF